MKTTVMIIVTLCVCSMIIGSLYNEQLTRREKIILLKDNCPIDSFEGQVALWAVQFDDRGVEPNERDVSDFYKNWNHDYGAGTIIQYK